MGDVYLAEDPILKRKVALKYLSKTMRDNEAAIKRFELEARSAAAIDHPFIGKIYGVGELSGQPYIAMEYVEGQTLKQRLSEGPIDLLAALQLGLEVAEALEEAHRHGIVHCDLKPANLMLTPQGHIKVLDFGLAKRLSLDSTDTSIGDDLTQTGHVAGTIAYMSPEQAGGKKVDARSDLFSFGLVFFELLTGVHPFARQSVLATVSSILNEPARSLSEYLRDVPAGLQKLIDSLLEKQAERRCAAVGTVCQGLRELLQESPTSVPLRDENVIGILPFQDLSPEGDQQYFCDGLAEELIHTLSRMESLSVVARTSTFRFRESNLSVTEIGEALRARHILEGGVRKSRDRLRISLRLVNTADGRPLWAERFDCRLDDIFEIQDTISNQIRRKFELSLDETLEETIPPTTDNVEAYEFYLRARRAWALRTHQGLQDAVRLFSLCLERDPKFSRAMAGLADAYVTLGIYGLEPPEKVMPDAKRAARSALEAAPNLAEALVPLATVRAIYDWDDGAKSDFERALEINPGYANGHHWYANNYLLPHGLFEQARHELRLARRHDPLAPAIRLSSGLLSYLEGHYSEAVTEYKAILNTDPDFGIAHHFLGLAYLEQDAFGEAVNELEVAVKVSDSSSETLGALSTALARAGHEKDASEILERLEVRASDGYVSPVLLSQIHVALGDSDQALMRLEEASRRRATDLIWVRTKPLFEPLHSLPEFQRICEAMGLPLNP